MSKSKLIRPGDRVPLKLTAAERKLILKEMVWVIPEVLQAINATPAGQLVMMTLDELGGLMECLAEESDQCEDPKTQKMLDNIFRKLERLFDTYTDEVVPESIDIDGIGQDQLVGHHAAQITEWLTGCLEVIEQLGIKTRPLDIVDLAPLERDVLLLLPSLSGAVRGKLIESPTSFTFGEVAGMSFALAEELAGDGDAYKRLAVMTVALHLLESLQEGLVELSESEMRKAPKRPATKTKPTTSIAALYQFRITLLESDPPIWRRIQIHDCTLGKLHEHIQTAMGWTNSHLHRFVIDGQKYGDPELLDAGFGDFDCADSTVTMLSDILPEDSTRFIFSYEYDFGDGWKHEVLFEGCPAPDKRRKYPLCVEGERACPPEDCGGVWGYVHFLEAVADPEHEEHQDYVEWCGGSFSPEEFDPKAATRAMRKGLPDWRMM